METLTRLLSSTPTCFPTKPQQTTTPSLPSSKLPLPCFPWFPSNAGSFTSKSSVVACRSTRLYKLPLIETEAQAAQLGSEEGLSPEMIVDQKWRTNTQKGIGRTSTVATSIRSSIIFPLIPHPPTPTMIVMSPVTKMGKRKATFPSSPPAVEDDD
ncbi:hypothetical protein NE237_031493 [Protea cynaroides]|uniref:Uncharacterized protein n=1 Tax=Protea cynaroides TaxID=273540 RepID=A0A9Q0L283_9MAGN|nr:hypothetical protein NE237_031493 [Protea cynaroides]